VRYNIKFGNNNYPNGLKSQTMKFYGNSKINITKKKEKGKRC